MVRRRAFCPRPTVKASFQEFPLSSSARSSTGAAVVLDWLAWVADMVKLLSLGKSEGSSQELDRQRPTSDFAVRPNLPSDIVSNLAMKRTPLRGAADLSRQTWATFR